MEHAERGILKGMQALAYLPHSNVETLFAAEAHMPYFWILILALAVWSLVLKGFSLWYAARGGQYRWFVILLILNTLGLVEIVYLIWFRKGATGEVSNTLSQEQNKGTVAESD